MLLRRIWMLIDLSTSKLKSDPPPTDKLRKSSRENVTYSYYIMHPHTVNKNTTTTLAEEDAAFHRIWIHVLLSNMAWTEETHKHIQQPCVCLGIGSITSIGICVCPATTTAAVGVVVKRRKNVPTTKRCINADVDAGGWECVPTTTAAAAANNVLFIHLKCAEDNATRPHLTYINNIIFCMPPTRLL